MRAIIPLLVLIVGVAVMKTRAKNTTTNGTLPLVTGSSPTGSTTPKSGGTTPSKGTPSAVTSSTIGIVLSFGSVAIVRQVL
ncbi:uncharacterized protein LOC124290302 isoform X3 [Haliotis rubra]|uniref:uncharacterized protein LOC124290302 isoform X3 n=1 Tax=Haliotis rubra TaxID=36100 RepID=UPI001EE51B7B|nr:uncharacterized protein LOC124290302 isoform X3 [Haliotis rubra]XP_046582974.1 uncharacterized protein LOC124290302 isoform X3 [Haliotis rubra]